MNNAHLNYVVPMTDAIVARGQRAWGRIKATAAEQRELWREVGEALLVGRRLHKADQKFSQWCKDNGFGDMHRKARANAMWWAEVGRGVTPPVDLTHPTNIREWFNEQKTTSILPADLAEVEAEKVETIELDQRSAERVAKVINRSKGNDEGAEAAKQGQCSVWRFKATASYWEKAIKGMVCEVLTGYSAGHWRQAIGGNRGIRDVLSDEDLILYSRCYDTAVTLFRAGFTDVEKIKPILQESFGGRINPADYGLSIEVAA